MHINEGGAIHAVDAAMVQIRVNGVEIPMQVDTGASVTIISSELWQTLGQPSLAKCHRRLEAYDEHAMTTLGRWSVAVELHGRLHPADLVVVQSRKTYGLLGRDLLNSEQLFATDHTQKITTDILPAIKGIKATMELMDNARPKFCRARPVPVALEAKVNIELDRLQSLGVIEPIEGPVSNASPVVWVKKVDGSLRMCADYKVHVNDKIKSESHPIPTMECLFSKLKNAKKFAKIDLRSAYWQIELDEAAQ
jgi:hypothetical protein